MAGPPADASAGGFTAARQRPAGVRRGPARGRTGHPPRRRRARPSRAGGPTRWVACCSVTSRPGSGYRVREDATGADLRSADGAHRTRPRQWNKSIYDQSIPDDGYGYLTTRDGTKLAYTVHPPTKPGRHRRHRRSRCRRPDYAPPYPTLIEYSGYGYANPAGPTSGIAAVANVMGFAVVDIQMRGTGCSGGAFDFFEPLQSLDGYDIVETIARQPWVKGHKVGMMGISYGGISQLFTAADPAAAPGGDLAAVGHRRDRDDALPRRHPQHRLRRRLGQGAPAAGPAGRHRRRGHPAVRRAADRRRRHDVQGQPGAARRGRRPDDEDPAQQPLPARRSPTRSTRCRSCTRSTCRRSWPASSRTSRPAVTAPSLVRHFTGTTKKWFTFTNGAHIDSLDPETLNRWYDFLELYVAAPGSVARTPPRIRAAAPVDLPGGDGHPAGRPDHAAGRPGPAAADVRRGAGGVREAPSRCGCCSTTAPGPRRPSSQQPGDPYPGFEHSFATLPVPGTKARVLVPRRAGAPCTRTRRPSGTSTATPPTRASCPAPTSPAAPAPAGCGATPPSGAGTGSSGTPGTAVSYVSAPLSEDVTTVGAGAVQLWVRSSTPRRRLPGDGQRGPRRPRDVRAERLDARQRAQAGDRPPQHHEAAAEPAGADPDPPGQRRPADAAAAGTPRSSSRCTSRATPTAPAPGSGSRSRRPVASSRSGRSPRRGRRAGRHGATWRPRAKHPSRLVLPVVPGLSIDSDAPPCPSLRNEPCRDYVPFENQ